MLSQDPINQLAEKISGIELDHPLRVGIDGIDAAGKTTLASALVSPLQQAGRTVIRASIDGFHNPLKIRYQRGALDPEGYYRDSFDLKALQTKLLIPLGEGGSLIYQEAVFNFKNDAVVASPEKIAQPRSVLLFDGVFLFRSELRGYWDYKIFVDISFENCLQRAMTRDLELFGSKETIDQRYKQRYIPGQKLYLAESLPKDQADVIIQNDDYENPSIEWKR